MIQGNGGKTAMLLERVSRFGRGVYIVASGCMRYEVNKKDNVGGWLCIRIDVVARFGRLRLL